jgi:DNA ligase (NAD+)
MLEGWGEKSVQNLLDNIEESKSRPVNRVINSLGIPQVGSKMATVLAEYYGSIDRLSSATYEELVSIPDVGPKTAEGIITFFSQEQTKRLLEFFKYIGITTEQVKPENKREYETEFAGKVVVLTGTLLHYSRSKAEEIIRNLGGKTANSVSKNTDILIVGDNPGAKLDKAKKLGIRIISGKEFEKMIKEK